jgi:probable dihydroxyacetone kinase regulator
MNQTKKVLAESLRELLREKDISKITVSELAERAEVNRKTFYYHFRDVYEVLAWMFETEALAVVAQYDLATDYRKAISYVLDYLEENEYIISRLVRSHGRGEIRRFLHKDLFAVTLQTIEQVEINQHQHFDDDYKQFLAEFFTEAFAGTLLHWAEDPRMREREKLEAYTAKVVEGVLGFVSADGKTADIDE